MALDHGMTAQVGSGDPKKPNYFDLMELRFRQDVPAISVHGVPRHIAAFIFDGLFNEAGVVKPVGDLYIGTHAHGDGFLLVKLFRDSVDVLGDPIDVTDMEVLDQALGPSQPAKIPDSLIGYQSGPPTRSGHIKGCNIGKNRFRDTLQPINPFLVRLKQVFGSHVNVTAPKHFHGLLPETNHNGIFEYMAHEFRVRTIAVRKRGGGYRGFANRSELIQAYKDAHLRYYDGTAVPDDDWKSLVPKQMVDNRGIKVTISLGRTIENLPSVTLDKQFRIEIEQVDWTLPDGSYPADRAGRLAALKASIAADARFGTSHPWPMWERRGFTNFTDYWNGHLWDVDAVDKKGNLLCVGRRFDYTIVQPIVDRSVTPATNRPLIYNFYPGVGSTEQPILTGIVESDDHFFGRA